MRKGKDPEPDLRQMNPDPGGPKTCGSGSPTLVSLMLMCFNKCDVSTFASFLKAGSAFCIKLRSCVGADPQKRESTSSDAHQCKNAHPHQCDADTQNWFSPARDLGHITGHTDPKLCDERVLLIDLVILLESLHKIFNKCPQTLFQMW